MLFQGAARGFGIELHLAAEEAIGAEAAEREIGVGHRRLGAAEPVAGRTRCGAGALRADAQHAVLDPRHRAAAGADLENIHHRDLDRQRGVVAAQKRRAGGQRFALIDDAGFRRRAAHVESDRIRQADRMAERARADDAGGRARFHHADAMRLRLIGLVESAGRLHDEERAFAAFLAQMLVDLAKIGAYARADIGIGRDGRAALEFAIFLAELVARRNEHPRMIAQQDLFRARLVLRVAIGMEEHDRDGIDAELLESLAECDDLVIAHRRPDRAVGDDALVDLEAQRALDQRHVLLEEKIVRVRPVDAADLVNVAKALGGEQRRLGAGALQQRVDGDGRAVKEEPGVLISGTGFGDAVVDALNQALRRRQALAEEQLAAGFVESGDIGESAADIGSKPQAFARARRICHRNFAPLFGGGM